MANFSIMIWRMKTFPFTISHSGNSWPARKIKSADLSTGYRVYLFQRDVASPFTNAYIVAVKSPIDSTAEWSTFEKLNKACEYYLGMLSVYA